MFDPLVSLREELRELASREKALMEFCLQNRKLVDEFEDLSGAVSDSKDKAKALLRTLNPDSVVEEAGFIARVRVSRTYDCQALLHRFPSMRAVTGLVKETVDPKILGAAVKAGLFPEEAVRECKTVTHSVTPEIHALSAKADA